MTKYLFHQLVYYGYFYSTEVGINVMKNISWVAAFIFEINDIWGRIVSSNLDVEIVLTFWVLNSLRKHQKGRKCQNTREYKHFNIHVCMRV